MTNNTIKAAVKSPTLRAGQMSIFKPYPRFREPFGFKARNLIRTSEPLLVTLLLSGLNPQRGLSSHDNEPAAEYHNNIASSDVGLDDCNQDASACKDNSIKRSNFDLETDSIHKSLH